MTLSKAKEEFSIRYYLWATSEFKREIDEAFPNLGLFNAGSDRNVLQYMRRLDSAERWTLAQALLKRFHPKAVEALGESVPDDQKRLLSEFDEFRGIETGKRIYQSMGQKGVKFASKSKLRRMILTKFKKVFGDQCFGLELVGLDPELIFKMKCCGWILHTRFEFNGKYRQIWYWHSIVNPAVIEPYRAPEMILHRFISLSAWLGTCSMTQWECLTDYEAEPACDAAIKFCGRFIEVAPKLLKGIEFDKITGE